MIAVLYGCVSMADIPYRAKTTLKLFLDKNEKTKAYSYEISNIEILRGTAESLTQPNCKISMPTVENPTGIAAPVALPSDKTSIDARILLNGVCDVNGVPLLAGGRGAGGTTDGGAEPLMGQQADDSQGARGQFRACWGAAELGRNVGGGRKVSAKML